MIIRHFLMKPKIYTNQNINGWFISENKKGIHCFWDGGISRGLLLKNIPWAHTPKFMTDSVYSTGLWSDTLDPIPVTDKWLNMLPCIPLEGVLYKKNNLLYLAATSTPTFKEILKTGPVYCSTSCNMFSLKRNLRWITKQRTRIPHFTCIQNKTPFKEELQILNNLLCAYGSNVYLLKHTKLPEKNAHEKLLEELKKYPNGLIIRDPDSIWTSKQTNKFLKATI